MTAWGISTALLLTGLSAGAFVTDQMSRPDVFVIHFPTGTAAVSPDAAPILDNVAAAWQQNRSAVLQISAHTDRSGSAHSNLLLSQRRADAVRAYLRGRAVPVALIQTVAAGESAPEVPTPDGIAEPRNRRAEVRFLVKP